MALQPSTSLVCQASESSSRGFKPSCQSTVIAASRPSALSPTTNQQAISRCFRPPWCHTFQLFTAQYNSIMSSEEQDYAIETADAGASATIPMEAGQIKKGGFMMIKGKPCKVLNISVSKTGKHGHAKCNFTAVDIFSGKKYEDMIPSSHGTTVPIVNKNDWEIIDIEGDELTLMDEGGNQKTDLNLPTFPETMADEIREAWNGGESSVVVTVQSAVGIEQVIAFKKV